MVSSTQFESDAWIEEQHFTHTIQDLDHGVQRGTSQAYTRKEKVVW